MPDFWYEPLSFGAFTLPYWLVWLGSVAVSAASMFALVSFWMWRS
jgi:hypothetical protein